MLSPTTRSRGCKNSVQCNVNGRAKKRLGVIYLFIYFYYHSWLRNKSVATLAALYEFPLFISVCNLL